MVDRLLAKRRKYRKRRELSQKQIEEIAEQAGVATAVVWSIHGDTGREKRTAPPLVNPSIKRSVTLDDGVIRAIERMLSSGYYTPYQIAGELHVSPQLVVSISQGEYPVPCSNKWLAPGEQALRRPVFCPGCRGSIYVVPCRVCKVRKLKSSILESIADGLTDDRIARLHDVPMSTVCNARKKLV